MSPHLYLVWDVYDTIFRRYLGRYELTVIEKSSWQYRLEETCSRTKEQGLTGVKRKELLI